MLKSSLCDYSDAYLHVSGTITDEARADDNAKQLDERNKEVIFKIVHHHWLYKRN